VGEADGDAEPFAGWIALTRTIELSLDRARRRLPPATGDPAGGSSVMTPRSPS
jgi:hypothetical protein